MLGRHPNWVPNPMETLAPCLEQHGYSCILTSGIENRYLRLIDIVRTIFRERKQIDVICLQTYSGPSFVVEDIASWLSKFFEIPVIMFLHGGAMPDFMERFPKWSKRVLRRADHIITPSTFLLSAIEHYGFDAAVIPNLLPLEQYDYRQRQQVEPKLFWMRTFYDYYNPEMAIEVIQRVVRRYPNATLTMAGQDKGLLDPMKAMVRNAGLEANVRFPGFLSGDTKRKEFCSHDIFLNTTRIDNMPICLLEAGASGLPIVSTNVGGIPHLVRHEESALLVPSGDVEEMTRSVFRLLDDSSLAARLSLQGRKLAEQCDTVAVIPLWEGIFKYFSSPN